MSFPSSIPSSDPILPEIPLEIQYLILESADWLQQSVLRQVCTNWRDYIDTSDTLLDDCYKATTVHEEYEAHIDPKPRFHNVIDYRSGFVRTPTGFNPCILHRNDAGEVVDWSPEADLSIYMSDPLLKPGTDGYIDGITIYCMDANGETTSYGTSDKCDDGSVASYLRATCRHMESVGHFIQGKYFRVWLSLRRTEAGDFGLKLFVQPEVEANEDQRADSLIGQLSIS
ncbi:hypothetical protein TWF281_003964 [Arthrobotrys megalospora]